MGYKGLKTLFSLLYRGVGLKGYQQSTPFAFHDDDDLFPYDSDFLLESFGPTPNSLFFTGFSYGFQ